jgi:mRNA-degrading endonuclease toxin of MazEF toxin-antitoxin module
MADLGYTGKVRPVLVLSMPPGDINRDLVSYIICIANPLGNAYEIPHRARGMKPGAYDVRGLGATDQSRLLRKLGRLNKGTLKQVETMVKAWLGLK